MNSQLVRLPGSVPLPGACPAGRAGEPARHRAVPARLFETSTLREALTNYADNDNQYLPIQQRKLFDC